MQGPERLSSPLALRNGYRHLLVPTQLLIIRICYRSIPPFFGLSSIIPTLGIGGFREQKSNNASST